MRTLLLVAIAALALPAAHAQGLGGVLNSAKAKARQATSAPLASASPAAAVATQAGPPATPPELTPDSNGEYTRALLSYANTLTFHPHGEAGESPSEVYWYCWLRAQGHPVRFTWDAAALKLTADNRTYLSGFVEDASTDLVSGLNGRFGPTLKPQLAKVKEIHFTTSPKKRSLDDFGTVSGFFFSFNPATGVLTAAMSEPDGVVSISEGLMLTHWITKYVK